MNYPALIFMNICIGLACEDLVGFGWANYGLGFMLSVFWAVDKKRSKAPA